MRFLLVVTLTSAVAAAQTPVPRYEVTRAAAAPTIDGKLDDAAWGMAPAVTLQFLWESPTGAKQLTRARLLWDGQALYVGFDADDADIAAQYQQRDDPTYRRLVAARSIAVRRDRVRRIAAGVASDRMIAPGR